MCFNFIKHWPIQNLFNNKLFPIYGIHQFSTAETFTTDAIDVTYYQCSKLTDSF